MNFRYDKIFVCGVLFLFLISCSAKNNHVNFIEHGKRDTIAINGHTIYVDSITELQYKVYKNVNQIFYDSTAVRKVGNTLTLNVGQGEKLVLKDSLAQSDNVDQVTYTYVGFIKEIRFYIIMAQYYETGEYLLINSNTGEQTRVWGVPKLSPNKKYIVCYSDAIGYDVMPNGIQMWALSPNGKLDLAWEYNQLNWAPEDIVWVNDNSIYVTKRIPDFLSPTNKEEISYCRMSFP